MKTNLAKTIVQQLKMRQMVRTRIKEAELSYHHLANKRRLSRAQEREVVAFYRKLTGKRVPLVWHNYYYSKTGKFAKELLPDSLYRYELIGRANNFHYRDAYADKNMIDVYLPDVRIPRPILKNMNGTFYMDGKPVERNQAIERLQNLSLAIIKPSLESHGNGVRRLHVTNGMTNVDGMSLEQLLDSYKQDYLIQECVQQHDKLAALNPSSLNTFRIVTFRIGMEVLVLFCSIRIGREGNEIDNLGAGGLSVCVSQQGVLDKYAYTHQSDVPFEKTDSGIVIDGYAIPSFEKAVQLVKTLHFRFPFFDMIGWDVSIDKDEEPVIIEWNVRTELSQLSYGPAFGDNTERIIRELWPRENTRQISW